MGRPETKYWVSPASVAIILCLIQMWQGHAVASTIFPLSSNSRSGSLRHSSTPWDFDDIESSDNEYSSFFPDEDMLSSFEQNHDTTSTTSNVNKNRQEDISNSLGKSDYFSMMVKTSGKFDDVDKGVSYRDAPDATKRITLPQTLYPARTEPLTVSVLKELRSFENKGTISHLAVKQSRFGKGKITTSEDSTPPAPSHDMQNSSNNESGNDAQAQRIFEKVKRFFPNNSIKNGKNGETTAAVNPTTTTSTTLWIHEASKNQSQHGTGAFGPTNTISSLQFKFPYRIPFPYVRRGNNEDEHKKAYIKSWNTNEEQQRPTDPSKEYYYTNGDVRLQRTNRSKRSTLPTENTMIMNRETGFLSEKREDKDYDAHVAENPKHKSSEGVPGSSLADDNRSSSIGGDEVAETNVRDNATSRPPLPSNPVEVLQRLTRLLDRMLRELSTFGQKFTLRLIRMTERQDIDQMQEIMRDFDISPEKPIFFIAGGLRKLNGTVATRVVPISSVVEVTAANLTENGAIVLNETVQNAPPEPELPVAFVNLTEEAQPILPSQVDDGITMVPILRPIGNSSLPVDSDADEDQESAESTTTAAPEPAESEMVIIPSHNSTKLNGSSELINATPESLSTQRPLLESRRKRAVPEFDEFIFLPIPGRSARTENPYDDDDNESDFYPEDKNQWDENERWYDSQQKYEQLTSADSILGRNTAPINYKVLQDIERIHQSQKNRNDELSSDDYKAIIGGVSGSSGVIPPSTATTTPVSTIPSLNDAVLVSGTSEDIDLDSLPNNFTSIKSEQSVESNEKSNDQHSQGELNIHPVQTENAAISTAGENNVRHVEKDLSTKEELRPRTGAPAVENADARFIQNNSQFISTDQTASPLPNLENITKPISSFVHEKLKVDETLNLAPETSFEEQGKITLESENKLQIPKSLTALPPPSTLSEIASGSTELLYDKKESGNSQVSTSPVSLLIPNKTHELVEQRSYHSNSAGNENAQSVMGKVPKDDVMLIKDGRVDSEYQQLFSSKLKSAEIDSGKVGVSSLNHDVTSENDRVISVPPTHSSSTVKHPQPVADISSSPTRAPILTEAIVVPAEPLAILENSNVETPHRAVLINNAEEGNQNNPQVEIKAMSPSSHANALLPESEINIPVAKVPIKETYLTPNSDQMPSISLENVPVVLPKIQQKPVTTNLNSIQVEEVMPTRDPTGVVVDPLLNSKVAPPALQTEASNTLLVSTIPAEQKFPSEIILDGESDENKKKTGNKQQTFTLGENQESLVGGQSIVVGDIMKKVGEEANQVEGGKVQVSPNQPTFHTPTVPKESQLIGNNNATFLPADKIVPTAHTAEHAVVREVETPPNSPVVQKIGATDNVDAIVRNTGAAIVQNSDAYSLDGKRNGSIVAPIVSDNIEVRNPIATGISAEVASTGKENDALSQGLVTKNSLPLPEPTISLEPSNVLLSTNDIKLPLTKSTGNIVSEDRLNADSQSEHSPLSVVPISASDSSKNVDVHVEKTPIAETESVNALHVQDVTETVVNKETDGKAVNDLSKIVQNNPKPEVVKVEELVGQQDVHVDTPAVEVVPEPVEFVKVESPVAQVLPVPLPTEKIVKVAAKEPEVKEIEKVAEAEKIQDNGNIAVVPDEQGIIQTDLVKPSTLEPLEIVKVEAPIAPVAQVLSVPLPTEKVVTVAAEEPEEKDIEKVADSEKIQENEGISVVPDEHGILQTDLVQASTSEPLEIVKVESPVVPVSQVLPVSLPTEKVVVVAAKESAVQEIQKVAEAEKIQENEGIAVVPDEHGIIQTDLLQAGNPEPLKIVKVESPVVPVAQVLPVPVPDNPKPEVVKVELAGQQDVHLDTPAVEVVPEPMEFVKVESPVAQVLPVPVPVENTVKVAAKEPEVQEIQKVVEAEKIQENEGIAVVPDEQGIIQPDLVQPSTPGPLEIVKVEAPIVPVSQVLSVPLPTEKVVVVAAKAPEVKDIEKVAEAEKIQDNEGIAVVPGEQEIIETDLVQPSTPGPVKIENVEAPIVPVSQVLSVPLPTEKVVVVAAKEPEVKDIEKVADSEKIQDNGGIAVVPDEYGVLQPVVAVVVKVAESLLATSPDAEKVVETSKESVSVAASPISPIPTTNTEVVDVKNPPYPASTALVSTPLVIKSVDEKIVSESEPSHVLEAVVGSTPKDPLTVPKIVSSDVISKVELPPSTNTPMENSVPDNTQVQLKPATTLQSQPLTQPISVIDDALVVTPDSLDTTILTKQSPNPVVIPDIKGTQEGIVSAQASTQTLPITNTAISPTKDIALEQPTLVQPVGAPVNSFSSKIPSTSGDENIVASLPQGDPDSAFGIKPIVLQPQYQIPALRPTIPERPHPDYLTFLSQGVDPDSMTFSAPTTPVIIRSPPVISGYSPSSIIRRHQQMMQNYFNGMLDRRALPV